MAGPRSAVPLALSGSALACLLSVASAGCASGHAAPTAHPDAGATLADAGGEEAGPPLPSEVTFPAGFLWGTATAAFQVEKGDSNTDWTEWVATPGKIANG